jgi:hypothetical protein
VAWSLAVIAMLVGGSMLASWVFPRNLDPKDDGSIEGSVP